MTNTCVQSNIYPEQAWQISDMKRHLIESGPALQSRGQKKNLDSHLKMLFQEFLGQPYILYYHAFLIVNIRREINLEINLQNFKKLWMSENNFLLSRLSLRWLISATDTFCEYGEKKEGRSLAYAATLASAICKLYETEKIVTSSIDNKTDYDISKSGPNVQLFDGISAFAIGRGDIVYNLLKKLHKLLDNTKYSSTNFSWTSFIKKWIFCDTRTRSTMSINSYPVESQLLEEVMLRLCTHDTVFRRFSDIHFNKRTQWRPRPRRVCLFNDTSTNGHYGCQAVMNNIYRQLKKYNTEVIFVHSVGRDWKSDPNALSAFEKCDLVIVNAEGSMHSTSQRAIDLSAIGPYCRDKGIESYLINASFQNNNSEIYRNISEFTHVWVRDEFSGKTLTCQGIPHSYCANLNFINHLPQSIKKLTKNLLLVDSVREDVLNKLIELSKNLEVPLYSIKENKRKGVAQILIQKDRSKVKLEDTFPCSGTDDFIKLISEHSAMITGRYHAVCFAISLRIPFFAYPSNTAKIEALIHDVGLNPNRILDLYCDIKTHQMPQPFSSEELESIEFFLQRQQASEDLMFLKILNKKFTNTIHG